MKHKHRPPKGHWRPLVKLPRSAMYRREEVVHLTMQEYGLSYEAAVAKLDAYDATVEWWLNEIYQVEIARVPANVPLIHLNIRRRDGAVIRDWRDLQRIKNQLIGPECEAIEIFPAESRLVDTSNKYHLWAVADPTFRFQLGFFDRDVVDDEGHAAPGLKQRPLTQADSTPSTTKGSSGSP